MEVDSKNSEHAKRVDEKKKTKSEDSNKSESTDKPESRGEIIDESKRKEAKKRSRSRSRSRDRKERDRNRKDSRNETKEISSRKPSDRNKDRDRERERDRDRDRERDREREKDNKDRKEKYQIERDRRKDTKKPKEERARKEKEEEEEYIRAVEEKLKEEEIDPEEILERRRKEREAILMKHTQSIQEKKESFSIEVIAPLPIYDEQKETTQTKPKEIEKNENERGVEKEKIKEPDNESPMPAPPISFEGETTEFLAADYDDREVKKEEQHKKVSKVEVTWAKTGDDSSDDESPSKDFKPLEQDEIIEVDDTEDFTLKADPSRDISTTVGSKKDHIKDVSPTKKNRDDMFAPPEEDDMFALYDPQKKFVKKVSTNIEVAAGGIDTHEDEEGYYKLRIGEVINSKYQITSYLGKGVFSTVMKAIDTRTNTEVAIKMIRNNDTMYKAGQKELSILKKLNESDPQDKRHIVRVKDSFEHRKHLCIVFESLEMNLREVIRKFGKEVGLNIQAVKHYGIHLFMSLDLLKSVSIIHADLKPDNVLVDSTLTQIKLADLGSASYTSENEITPYLVSRFYRAPEIILGLPYDCSIDVWAAGCTLYELYTGKILFPGSTNNQMLKLFMQVKGKFPKKMIRKGQLSGQHFDSEYRFISYERDSVTNREVSKTMSVVPQTRELSTLLKDRSNMSEEDKVYLRRFIDLLDKCFQLNPEQRITPKQALKHPFFAKYKKA